MEQKNREEIIKIETKMENIENNVSEVKEHVAELSDNINNLVIALTKSSQQSTESKEQIRDIKKDIKTLFDVVDKNKTFQWKMAIAIVLLANGTALGKSIFTLLGF